MSFYYTILFIIHAIFTRFWVEKYCDDGDAISLLASIVTMLFVCYCIFRMVQA